MPLRNGGFVFYVDVWAFFNRPAVGLFELRNISQLIRGRTMCASTSGGEVRFSPPATPYLQFLISHSSFLIEIVPPSYLPTFSLRPDFALFFCPFAQEKDSHSMEKALLSFRQQGNFYNVLFPDLCRITGGSNAVRCSS